MKNSQFSIISFFDPYGDNKSTRKQFSRKNFESDRTVDEVKKIIESYSNGEYYHGVEFASVDGRSKKFSDFDKSHFLNEKEEPVS